MVIVILSDLVGVTGVIVQYCMINKGFREADISDYNYHVAVRWVTRMALSFWAIFFITIFKVFCSFRWLCRPTRKNFKKYYLYGMT